MQGCGSGNIATRPLHLKYPCQVSNQIAKQQPISKSICLIPTPIDFNFECLLDDAYPTTQKQTIKHCELLPGLAFHLSGNCSGDALQLNQCTFEIHISTYIALHMQLR